MLCISILSPLQGILFHPAKETRRRAWPHKQGWLAPHSQAILTILIVLMRKYHLFVAPQDGERIAFDWFALCAWLRLPLGQDHPWRPLQIWKLVSCNGNLNRNMVFDKIGFSRIKITATNETRQTPKKKRRCIDKHEYMNRNWSGNVFLCSLFVFRFKYLKL